MHDPSEDCYKAAIALLLYLGNTKDLVGLYYDGDTSAPKGFGTGGQFNGDQLRKIRKNIEDNAGFVAYSDASWRSKFTLPTGMWCTSMGVSSRFPRSFSR